MNEIDRSYNVLETEDGYVVSGNSIIISGNIYWWGNLLAKIDFNGGKQYIKYLVEDSIDYFFSSYPGFMIKDSNHFYAVGIRRTHTFNGTHDESLLMYLNEYLDTLWSKKFGEHSEPYDTAYWFTCINKIQTDDLILAGLWKPLGMASNAYLRKVDELGQSIWDKSFASSSYIQGYSVSQTSDQGFIIGCGRYTPGYNETLDPVLIKTDFLGNQEWIKNLGSQFMDNKAVVCISKDSMILSATNYADSMYTSDVSYSKINIVKIDNLGNIIWNKNYGASQPNNYLLNIRVLQDSSIITVGSLRKYNPEPDWVGWILKTDSDGDSLWYREYFNLSGQQSRNYLYDVIETSDNGLIACGYVEPYPPDTGSVDTWVIKLDSIGCEWAGCDTTVGIVEHESIEAGGQGGGEAGKLEGVEVWPNPASEWVVFTLPDVVAGGTMELVVYDLFGRKVGKVGEVGQGDLETRRPGEYLPDNRMVLLDVASYPAGMYIAVARDKKGRRYTGKFVVVGH